MPNTRTRAARPGFTGKLLRLVTENTAFRRVVFTGARTQLVVMSLPPHGEIGSEKHERVEQVLFCADGEGIVELDGACSRFRKGDVVVVPPGVRHNVIEHTGIRRLDLYTVYAPPNHLPGRVHETKADADAADAAFDAGAEQCPRASLAALSNALLYGTDHKLGLRVPRGGSACASCRWVRRESDGPHCANGLWQLWPRDRGGGGGKSRLPVKDATTYCCDLWKLAGAAERREAEAAPAKLVKTEGLLRKLLAAAEAHGEESGVEHEAGDLRDLLSACWKRLSPEQRREVYAEQQALHGEPSDPITEAP